MAGSNGTQIDETRTGLDGNGTITDLKDSPRPQETEGTPISDTEAKILNGFSIAILTICFTMLLYGLVTRPFLSLLAKVLH